MVRYLWIGLPLLAACEVAVRSGVFLCTGDSDCPDDQRCWPDESGGSANHYCYDHDVYISSSLPGDAGPKRDAGGMAGGLDSGPFGGLLGGDGGPICRNFPPFFSCPDAAPNPPTPSRDGGPRDSGLSDGSILGFDFCRMYPQNCVDGSIDLNSLLDAGRLPPRDAGSSTGGIIAGTASGGLGPLDSGSIAIPGGSAGGSAAGGLNAGGSAAGGLVAGGLNAGGSAAGGVAAGGLGSGLGTADTCLIAPELCPDGSIAP